MAQIEGYISKTVFGGGRKIVYVVVSTWSRNYGYLMEIDAWQVIGKPAECDSGLPKPSTFLHWTKRTAPLKAAPAPVKVTPAPAPAPARVAVTPATVPAPTPTAVVPTGRHPHQPAPDRPRVCLACGRLEREHRDGGAPDRPPRPTRPQ